LNSIPTVTRWVVLASVAGLIGLILVWNLVISPPQSAPVVVALGAYLLPLLAILPGLLRQQTGALIAAALISLIYLTHALVILASGGDRSWPAMAEAGLALALLISASLQSRWQRMLESGQAPPGE
jgi:uncharacterized membrane protein